MKNASPEKDPHPELKTPYETQRSFLLKELSAVEKVLAPLKGAEANALRAEAAQRRSLLEQEESTFLFLTSSAKGITELKERVEALVTRQNIFKRIPASVWLSIFPALILLYFAVLGIWQWANQDLVYYPTQTATTLQTGVPAGTVTPPAPPTPTP